MGNCCGKGSSDGVDEERYEPLLPDDEQESVNSVMHYLEHKHGVDFFQGEPHECLRTLAFSTNPELQRSKLGRGSHTHASSAAVTYSEATEDYQGQLSALSLEPLIFLSRSKDIAILKPAVAALSNIAFTEQNKEALMQANASTQLVALLSSGFPEVACFAAGAITNITANSSQFREEVSALGAIPGLLHLCAHGDADATFYALAGVSNLAVEATLRDPLASAGAVRCLLAKLSFDDERVKCQACLALRNLASDEEHQRSIVMTGALKSIISVITTSHTVETLRAAAALLRNLSIHESNEIPMLNSGCIPVLLDLFKHDDTEVLVNSAGCLRNLSANDTIKEKIVEVDGLRPLLALLKTPNSMVQSEAAAAVAVVAVADVIKPALVAYGAMPVLIKLTNSQDATLRANAAGAIGNISTSASTHLVLLQEGIASYLTNFAASSSANAQHLAAWTLLQLAKGSIETKLALSSHTSNILPTAVKLLESEDSEVQNLASMAISSLSSQPMGEQFDEQMKKVLGSVAACGAIGAMIELSYSPYQHIAYACAKAGALPSLRDLRSCIQHLSTAENQEVQTLATQTLNLI